MSEVFRPIVRLVKASSARTIAPEQPYWAGNMIHLYLQLSLGLDLEGAEAKREAKRALEFIRQAADASYLSAREFDGSVLEIHGRTIHLGVPFSVENEVASKTYGTAALLHHLLKATYARSGPNGWRMAADHGPTVAVQCSGIHQDTSIVSLSPAANHPAKQLGRKMVGLGQLGANENGQWVCRDLDELERLNKGFIDSKSLVKAGSVTLLEELKERRAELFEFSRGTVLEKEARVVNLQAAPMGPGSPTTAEPYSCFGMVVSMDLDGFSARVSQAAKGSELEQQKLAVEFRELMAESARFAAEHNESFIQFPFAGDNAIFALVKESVTDYEIMKKVAPVRVAVQWEDRMGDRARMSNFGGWAQVTAGGGVPHGNSLGNLHIAGISLEGRRFLVGVGPGMRYAREGFAQVEPDRIHLAMHSPDLGQLHGSLRRLFKACDSNNGNVSSNYEMAEISKLKLCLQDLESEKQKAIAAVAGPNLLLGGSRPIHRPHSRGF